MVLGAVGIVSSDVDRCQSVERNDTDADDADLASSVGNQTDS